MLIKSFYHFKLNPLGLIGLLMMILGLIYGLLNPLNMNPTTIVEQMEQWGHWAIVGFLGLYFILTLVGIPAIPITVAGGVFFGIFWGTLLSIIGATLGAIAAFRLTRSCLRKWVQKNFGHHPALIRFNRAATKMPFRFVLFVRLAPVFPFNLSNFLFGLTPIGYKPYIMGTFLGIIPGTLAYTGLGVTGKQALEQGDRFSIFLSLIIGGILCLLPLFKAIVNRHSGNR
jgi:uncharacterized membrane protein YdjX (TVP38/TMEM64 family)